MFGWVRGRVRVPRHPVTALYSTASTLRAGQHNSDGFYSTLVRETFMLSLRFAGLVC